MEILDIIKESFIFPSQNLEKLVIYLVLVVVVGILIGGGAVLAALSFVSESYLSIIGVILFIIGLILSFIISGYQVGILKTGIDQVDKAPAFDWKNNIITGIKLLVVNIVYFIIPAIIVLIVGLITNIPGNVANIAQQIALSSVNSTAMANSTGLAVNAIPQAAIAGLLTSITITGIIAVILFIIFAFLATMGQARLANTASLGNALNIPEAFRDIGRIGYGKVIAVVILVIIVVVVINGVLGYIYGQIPQLAIISIIVTPYLTFFSQRAIGLLYSDIA